MVDSTELCYLSASELGHLIHAKQVSPVEVVEAHLSRIDSLEPVLNSFITLVPDRAIAAARRAEQEIEKGKYRGSLHGIPFALKDLFYVKGIRNSSGTRLFDDFVPTFDSTVAARFKEAGAVFLGKLNMHQLAYGIAGENPDYGHMHNPWNPELIAGGSSGGSGSAAAAGECTLTMGSDTGGSIRIPAALCGIVGLKPTYGRLSRHGIAPLSWSQDHAGPMTRTVEDCALVMNAVAGHDPEDTSSVKVPVPDYTKALTGDIRGLKVGVPKEYFGTALDPQVEAAVRKALGVLGELGAIVTDISWPMYDESLPIANTILLAEGAASLGELARVQGPHLYPPVRLRIEAGFFVSAADYLQAQRARVLFVRDSREMLNKVDVLAGPTLPVTAYKIGDQKIKVGDQMAGPVAALTQYTRPFNLNGFPAVTVPCGFSDEGLPIGLQLAGKPFDEETVLRVGHAYEQATDWHNRRPLL